MRGNPTFSFIIPVRNGEDTIAECLGGILSQELKDFEVIVVDNLSTDRTSRILRSPKWKKSSSPKLRVLSCKRLGRSQARNHGARAARGTYLAFVDADVVLEPNWLKSMARFLKANPCDAVATRILPHTTSDALVDSYRLFRKAWHSGEAASPLQSASGPLPTLNTAACVISRDAFERFGGFDERLVRNEDTEFSFRLFLAGYVLGGTSQAVSKVHFFPKLPSWRRGWGYLLRSFDVGIHIPGKGLPSFDWAMVAGAWQKSRDLQMAGFAFLVEGAFFLGGGAKLLRRHTPRPDWQLSHGRKTILFNLQSRQKNLFIAKNANFLFTDDEVLLFRGLNHQKALPRDAASGLRRLLRE